MRSCAILTARLCITAHHQHLQQSSCCPLGSSPQLTVLTGGLVITTACWRHLSSPHCSPLRSSLFPTAFTALSYTAVAYYTHLQRSSESLFDVGTIIFLQSRNLYRWWFVFHADHLHAVLTGLMLTLADQICLSSHNKARLWPRLCMSLNLV